MALNSNRLMLNEITSASPLAREPGIPLDRMASFYSHQPEFQQQNHICHIIDGTQYKKWNTLGVEPNLPTKILTGRPLPRNV